jgi:hypothetical protein
MGHWASPGIGDVGSYQVAGTPYVSGNIAASKTATITFKFVTSEVQVTTSDAGVTIHFGDASSTTYTLPTGLSTFRVRCKKVVIVTPVGVTANMCASLTGIKADELEQHTQSDYGTTSIL